MLGLGQPWVILVLINLLTAYPPTAVQCERRPVAAPARKKQRRVGPSYGCGQRAATGPSPTGSRLFMPQDLGLQVAAKIPSPPPAAASRPFILEPPVCGPDALGPGQVGSDGVRDSRSSDSVPPLPAASHISPEPRGMQRQTPLTFSCWALSREHLNLKLDLPAFHVPTTSVNYIYELATNLLDQSVDWACTVPAFRSLQEHDRLALLQHSWSDLVLLGAVQCSRAFPKTAFVNLGMHAHRNHLEKAKGDRIAGQVMAIKGFISTLKGLNMDGVEYGYLKAAALFKPGTGMPEAGPGQTDAICWCNIVVTWTVSKLFQMRQLSVSQEKSISYKDLPCAVWRTTRNKRILVSQKDL